MKQKILIILLSFLLPSITMAAGRIAGIWTQPAVYKADEPVSFFFDLTGTDLQGETEGVYMWSWFPSEPDKDHWSNPSDFAKLKHVEGNIWRLDLIPTEYYKLPAEQINAFYGLLKNKDGSKVTDAFAPDANPSNAIVMYDMSTIKKNTSLLDYYPKAFTADKPLSILINANNTWSNCETTPVQGQLADAPDVHMHGGVNNWELQVQNNQENKAKTTMANLGDGIYRMDITPSEYFGFDDKYVMKNINMVFADFTWAKMGKDAGCNDFIILAPDVPAEPISELIFFPQKVSKKDILCIIRKLNESYVSKLDYTITAGAKTITGSFEGTQKEFTAYIDLSSNLRDIAALDKIHVVIKDNTGRIVSNTDIPLVQLSE